MNDSSSTSLTESTNGHVLEDAESSSDYQLEMRGSEGNQDFDDDDDGIRDIEDKVMEETGCKVEYSVLQ